MKSRNSYNPLTILSTFLLGPLLLCLSDLNLAQNQPVLAITVHQNSIQEELKQWQQRPVSCQYIAENFNSPKDRGAAELKIICHAFIASGSNPEIILIGVPNHVRSLFLLEVGKADLAAESVWLEEINLNKVWASKAVITHGEFEKAPYTTPSHPLQSTKAENINLSNYQGVAVRTWTHDLYTMTQLSDQVASAVDFDSIYRMLEAGRSDYTFLESHHHGNDFFSNGKTQLVPVEGVYVVLEGTRHMTISKSSKHGVWARKHLNQGINKLAKTGKIREIYEQSGFLHSKKDPKRLLEASY
ncbi:hypothetical protein [Agaribacterium sp. ZY112]|uniref:hypothetical protein n=1 Tax=Agaribacterium sp. ZY112 TaxID=3233574 RepID=UPI00352679DF